MRSLIQENHITVNDLIAPLFVKQGKNLREIIPSMPGIFRLSPDNILKEVDELSLLGIKCISIFPVIDEKDKSPCAKESCNPDGINQIIINKIKNKFPAMLIMSDVALDPYSSDGHDGLVDKKTGEILNDQTLEVLNKMALVQAKAGTDIIGPSDMMDGRIKSIRNTLDNEGFTNVSIMSYTAKYASSFYSPFRDALNSAPKLGDKKSYQMDFHNITEALREAILDEEEGADILMVKPGLPYLDVIKTIKEHTHLPVAAYNVSGEYAMIKAAAEKGWLDEKKAMYEILAAFKRAKADIILTYFAKDMAKLLIELS